MSNDFVYALASPASLDRLSPIRRCTRRRSGSTARTTRSASPSGSPDPDRLDERVYGDPQVDPQTRPIGDVNLIGPRGGDDEAKRYAEALTHGVTTPAGVDTAIVRIFNTYGRDAAA